MEMTLRGQSLLSQIGSIRSQSFKGSSCLWASGKKEALELFPAAHFSLLQIGFPTSFMAGITSGLTGTLGCAAPILMLDFELGPEHTPLGIW
jgi:hypothetical protein